MHGLRIVLLVVAGFGMPSRALAEWSSIIGGPDSLEYVVALREGVGGNLFAAARTSPWTEARDGWLLHLDADGAIQRQSVHGTPSPANAGAASLAADGSAVFVGRDSQELFAVQNAWITRVDAMGSVAWATRIASEAPVTGRHFLVDVEETAFGWVAAGFIDEGDDSPKSAWLVHVDDNGAVDWQFRYDDAGTWLGVHDVVPTSDGGYVLTGWAVTMDAGTELWIMKVDAAGDIEWQRMLGGAGDDEPTGLIELAGGGEPGGGYVVCGVTRSFPSSGRGGWVLRFDALGVLQAQSVFADREWGDFQDVRQTADGELLLTGHIAEPGFSTSDLWLVKARASDLGIIWQRAQAADQSAWGLVATELSDGDFLVGGVWAPGHAEQALWLVRTDENGLVGGCDRVRDTMVTPWSPRVNDRATFATRQTHVTVVDTIAISSAETDAVPTDICPRIACMPPRCDDLLVSPQPCPGRASQLTAMVSDGEPPLTFEWDFDGDTIVDDTGNPVSVELPPGSWTVSVQVTDSCATAPESCETSIMVDVPAVPGEVSDVVAGRPPLLVADGGSSWIVENVADVDAYNLHVDAIGSWYFPTMAAGTACTVQAWTDLGDGTLELAHELPPSSWLVVTASNACAEGPAGLNSTGDERRMLGTWEGCGPVP